MLLVECSWRKIRQTEGKRAVDGSSVSVLNLVSAQSLHLVPKPRDIKATQRAVTGLFFVVFCFFHVQLSCAGPCRQLSHSASKFDQQAEPDRNKVPCREQSKANIETCRNSQRSLPLIHTQFFLVFF